MEGLIFDMNLLWMHSPIRDPHQTASSITSCAVHTHAEHCTGKSVVEVSICKRGSVCTLLVNLIQLRKHQTHCLSQIGLQIISKHPFRIMSTLHSVVADLRGQFDESPLMSA